MTSKELQYVEDTLGNAKTMQDTCANFASQLKDPELKSFVQGLSTQHQNCFNKFIFNFTTNRRTRIGRRKK